MTQEDKELLLRDLCGRLSYGVKVYRKWIAPLSGSPEEGIFDFCIFDIEILLSPYNWVSTEKGIREVREYDIKPYLFPLSSMTEEQKKELFELCTFCIEENWEGKKREVYAIEISSRADPAYCFDHNFYMWGVDMRAIDWLNAHHFDYRGLIPMGLAIDATGLNIY